MSTDEELMARYVAGESDAFRELFERYGPRLAGLFRRQIPRDADVQDLVQQTFLQLHRARNDFRAGSPLRPWLYTIALNLKRRYFRDYARKPAASLEVDPAAEKIEASAGLVRGEQAARVHAALAELAPAQREVIELHWFEGLPFAEVAHTVGASLSAVKVRAHRGYKKLREHLERV